MNENNKEVEDYSGYQEDTQEQILLRQVTDHIFQCLGRIDDDIEHVVFIRKNNKLHVASERFCVQQIDRFSRDVIISFGQILGMDFKKREAGLEYLISRVKNESSREKFRNKMDKLREKLEFVICARNKTVAHHEVGYNAELTEWYPAQLSNFVHPLNPCHCKDMKEEVANLFWELKEELGVEGVGSFFFSGKASEELFKDDFLGKLPDDSDEPNLQFTHECDSDECLFDEEES